MKKLFLSLCLFTLFTATGYAQDYAAYLGVKDTLTNADDTEYEIAITGKKSNVSFQTNVIKLTGTVAGTFKVFGSVDGTTYVTEPLISTALADATTNYGFSASFNGYKKYKLVIATTGTSTASQRSYVLYRKQ